MADPSRVGDEQTIFYVNVRDDGVDMDTLLDTFATRSADIRKPVSKTIVNVPGPIPTEVDAEDSIKKLKLIGGPTGDITLDEPGKYIIEIRLQDSVGGRWFSSSAILTDTHARIS